LHGEYAVKIRSKRRRHVL